MVDADVARPQQYWAFNVNILARENRLFEKRRWPGEKLRIIPVCIPKEEALEMRIKYAHVAAFVQEPSFQSYTIFILNCAYARLQEDSLSPGKT